MQAGTIVASNYLAMAQVLGESFLEHHPDSTFSVLVVDDGDADLPAEIGIVRLGDLDIAPADERLMRTVYDVMEFSTAVKPSFLRFLLAVGDGAACYLDPDIQVFSAFGPQADAALEHGIVLTPHVLSPVPRDGRRVDEETIMQSGMYNCGFLAVGPTARPFLDWWDARLRFDALVDFGRARFTDQRWVDWVPSLFDYVIDRDPGMNVAWWNIHDRPIDVTGSAPTVLGTPLRFVHFSGYDPQQPDLLSKHQLPRPRTDHAVGTGMRTLADAYGRRLTELGHVERRRGAYPWNRSHDGVELTTELRRAVRDAALDEIERLGEVRSVPDAFDPDGGFAAWVAEHVDGSQPTAVVADTSTASVDGSVEIVRTTPNQEPSPPGNAQPRNTYDVVFDWDDAHGHAVRLVFDHCEPGVVVDLGCGYAPHAEVLRDAGYEYVGLELDETSLAHLRDRGFVARSADLSRVDEFEATVDDALSALDGDAAVVAVLALDVLEHLVEPERLLDALSTWMERHDGSLLVTSVPNVAHRDIAAKLIGGRWDVTETGLLDHTHLRFFTDASLTAVMATAGFTESVRNDRVAARSDQRWPAGSPFTSPDTPTATVLGAIRDSADAHGDTYQMIRGYRTVRSDHQPAPSLMVTDPMPPTVALSVIADPGLTSADLDGLHAQLSVQSCHDWELLECAAPAGDAAARVAAFDALIAAANGAYVSFVERGEQVGPGWVEQFVDAMKVTVAGGAVGGDIRGSVLRCAVTRIDDGSNVGRAADPRETAESATCAFPTAAIRALDPGFDGRVHQAIRLRRLLRPFCGEVDTGVAAVTPSHRDLGLTTAETSEDTPIVGAPAADALTAVTEFAGAVDALQSEVARLRAENERLVRDNEWLNAELSPVPIRLVRRVLRRDASLD